MLFPQKGALQNGNIMHQAHLSGVLGKKAEFSVGTCQNENGPETPLCPRPRRCYPPTTGSIGSHS